MSRSVKLVLGIIASVLFAGFFIVEYVYRVTHSTVNDLIDDEDEDEGGTVEELLMELDEEV